MAFQQGIASKVNLILLLHCPTPQGVILKESLQLLHTFLYYHIVRLADAHLHVCHQVLQLLVVGWCRVPATGPSEQGRYGECRWGLCALLCVLIGCMRVLCLQSRQQGCPSLRVTVTGRGPKIIRVLPLYTPHGHILPAPHLRGVEAVQDGHSHVSVTDL